MHYLNKTITKYLKPLMVKNQFHRLEPRVFVRVRGDIVDTLNFQMSRWGNGFYIHYFCNLIYADEVCAYEYVGCRTELIICTCDNEMSTQTAIQNLINELTNIIFPWFYSINTIEDYIIKQFQEKREKNDALIEQLCTEDDCKILGKNYQSYLEKVKKISEEYQDVSKYNSNLKYDILEQAMKISPKDEQGNIVFGTEGIGELLDSMFEKEKFKEDIFLKKDFLMDILKNILDIDLDQKWLEMKKQQAIIANRLEKLL